jgi:hypothetical protein
VLLLSTEWRRTVMPTYKVEFVGGGATLSRHPHTIVCGDDHDALHWASDNLRYFLGAEVSSAGRQVGWVTTADTRSGVRVIFARR